jgi:hypothetical protein
VRQPTRALMAAPEDAVARGWSGLRGARSSPLAEPDPDLAPRPEALDARMEHVEAALDGLKDAIHRQVVREDERLADLRKRTARERIARELSAAARPRDL